MPRKLGIFFVLLKKHRPNYHREKFDKKYLFQEHLLQKF